MCDRTGNDDFSALRLRLFSWKQLALILVGVLAFPAFTKADFNGFGDFSNFNLNQTDGGSAPLISANSIQLTSNSDGQARSIFHVTRMGVETFDASFIYRMEPGSMFGAGIGAAFVLQNSAAGSDAIGPGNLAYQGISNSIAISLETSTSSQGNASFTGFYQNGVVDGGSTPAAPVSFLPGNPIFVQLNYNGSVLRSTLTDTVTSATHTSMYLIDIPTVIGSDLAFVGITARTGSASANQHFTDFRYNVPEPSAIASLIVGICTVLPTSFAIRRRRRLRR